jgi:hypothetical protein
MLKSIKYNQIIRCLLLLSAYATTVRELSSDNPMRTIGPLSRDINCRLDWPAEFILHLTSTASPAPLISALPKSRIDHRHKSIHIPWSVNDKSPTECWCQCTVWPWFTIPYRLTLYLYFEIKYRIPSFVKPNQDSSSCNSSCDTIHFWMCINTFKFQQLIIGTIIFWCKLILLLCYFLFTIKWI